MLQRNKRRRGGKRGTWPGAGLCLVAATAIDVRADDAPPADAAPAVGSEASGTGGVRGRVLDAGAPVAGAMVVREGTWDGAVTGADGAFAIDGLPAGRQRLV